MMTKLYQGPLISLLFTSILPQQGILGRRLQLVKEFYSATNGSIVLGQNLFSTLVSIQDFNT